MIKLNLPLVLVHVLTVTAAIESAAKPTETIMNLEDTEKSVKRMKIKNLLKLFGYSFLLFLNSFTLK